jgi:hypothetical protein
MNDKVLFWIDSGLAHFFIAKILKEEYDCDLFAIYDLNEAKKYFQNQKLVDFEKIWFYRDFLQKNNLKKPDLKYLSEFEKKYEINLWNVVYSDINFNEHNIFYKFQKNEILSILEQECKFFELVLDEINPDYLIIRMTDYSQNQIIQMMCKKRGVRVLTINHSRFGYRTIISQDTDFLDDDLIEEVKSNNKRSFEELLDVIRDYSNQQIDFRKKYQNSYIKKIFAILKFLRISFKEEYKLFFGNFGKTIFNVTKNEVNIFFKKKYRQAFLNKNALKNFKKESFVYFPLHLQPERSTLILASFCTDQIEMVKRIAKSIPIDYKLYVKEHPMQAIHGWRNSSFYKEILEIPNVELIHPTIKNEEMIKKCDLVTTITGTGGLEAAFYRKPSIVFANVIYSSLKSVCIIQNFEEMPKKIREALNFSVDKNDVNKYVDLIMKNSFKLDLSGVFYSLIDNYFYNGGYLKESQITENEMNQFLENSKKYFEIPAKEHIKIIKKLKRSKKEKS